MKALPACDDVDVAQVGDWWRAAEEAQAAAQNAAEIAAQRVEDLEELLKVVGWLGD